jgi:hypothetical protein
MSKADKDKPGDQGISKVKLALGAASLFLFIIGVKRTFQMDQHQTEPEPSKRAKETKGAKRRSRESERKK